MTKFSKDLRNTPHRYINEVTWIYLAARFESDVYEQLRECTSFLKYEGLQITQMLRCHMIVTES